VANHGTGDPELHGHAVREQMALIVVQSLGVNEPTITNEPVVIAATLGLVGMQPQSDVYILHKGSQHVFIFKVTFKKCHAKLEIILNWQI